VQRIQSMKDPRKKSSKRRKVVVEGELWLLEEIEVLSVGVNMWVCRRKTRNARMLTKDWSRFRALIIRALCFSTQSSLSLVSYINSWNGVMFTRCGSKRVLLTCSTYFEPEHEGPHFLLALTLSKQRPESSSSTCNLPRDWACNVIPVSLSVDVYDWFFVFVLTWAPWCRVPGIAASPLPLSSIAFVDFSLSYNSSKPMNYSASAVVPFVGMLLYRKPCCATKDRKRKIEDSCRTRTTAQLVSQPCVPLICRSTRCAVFLSLH
jgi:hypothetical protein